MGSVSSIYGWASIRLTEKDVVAILRSKGYEVSKISPVDVRVAEAYPDRWRKDHQHAAAFNPADVPGL